MTDAPRYRLVGYDIGTAPDENGGWVHWTDHEAEIARLTAERDAALAGAVKVKPLVWEDAAYQLCHDHWTASAFGGGYHMAPDEDSLGVWLLQWTIRHDDFCTRHGGKIYKHGSPESAQAAAQADYEARILAAIQPDPEAHQADLAKAWQPIETAPRGVEVGGNNAVSWMVLAWPDGEGGYHRQSGMMVGEKFYAALTFYIGGGHGGKHYALREVEIFPTYWMPDPPPPADLAAKIGGE